MFKILFCLEHFRCNMQDYHIFVFLPSIIHQSESLSVQVMVQMCFKWLQMNKCAK